jgi:hypothetical protein
MSLLLAPLKLVDEVVNVSIFHILVPWFVCSLCA